MIWTSPENSNARNPLSYSIIILPTWSGWQHHVVGKSLSLGVLRPLVIEQSSFANAAQRCWAGGGEAEHQPMSLERWWFSNLSAPFLGKPVRDQSYHPIVWIHGASLMCSWLELGFTNEGLALNSSGESSYFNIVFSWAWLTYCLIWGRCQGEKEWNPVWLNEGNLEALYVKWG